MILSCLVYGPSSSLHLSAPPLPPFPPIPHLQVGATKDLGIPQHWPVVPGHEVAGVVVAVGSDVTKFQTGDHVGVGCMVGSALTCRACKRGDENMCLNQAGATRNSPRANSLDGAPTLHSLQRPRRAPPTRYQRTAGLYARTTQSALWLRAAHESCM